MLDEIVCRCEAPGCNRRLDDGSCQLVFLTAGGERRAYECACGHVTVTVAAPRAEDRIGRGPSSED